MSEPESAPPPGGDWSRPALQIWPFALAPPRYQVLSTHGGDEDWLLYCPAALLAAPWPWELGQALQPGTVLDGRRQYLGTWGWAETYAVFGGVVVIFAHA